MRSIPLLVALCGCVLAAETQSLPNVFSYSRMALANAKARLAAGDAALTPALSRLLKDADKALNAKPESVMDKPAAPPSGDKHDYMSLAPYYWPDPSKPDGLPYIRKDGQFFPEAKADPDHNAMGRMRAAVNTLALGFYFTGKEAYAEHAAVLLRAWFLDPATKMNPNLNYAQAIRGLNEGRGSGIIDTVYLIPVADAAGLLRGAVAWTRDDERGLQAWFAAYADWLRTSKAGQHEAANANNHGVWYDVQLCTYAMYAGNEELARATIEAAKLKRVEPQIHFDGTMPFELARETSWHYTLYALEGWLTLSAIGENLGIDLANYVAPGGGSIRKAFDFMAPYADLEKKWPYTQISEKKVDRFAGLLHYAARFYSEPHYDELRLKLKLKDNDARYLLYCMQGP